MKMKFFSWFGAAILVLPGCSPSSSRQARPDADVVAHVEQNPITIGDLQARLTRFARPTTRPEKKRALEELVRTEAVYVQARARQFDQTPEIQARIKQLIVREFIEAEFHAEATVPGPKEVEAYYEDHVSEFRTPPQARAGVIFLQSSPKAQPDRKASLRQKAEDIRSEALKSVHSADFALLVQRHSQDQPTRYTGGDAGWMTQEQATQRWGIEVAEALFKLSDPSLVAPVVETPRGFHVIRLLEKKAEGWRGLDEVESLIRHRLTQAAREQEEEDFYASMKLGLRIEINEALLDSMELSPTEEPPPSMPGQQTVRLSALQEHSLATPTR